MDYGGSDSTSWRERMKDSFVTVLFGLLLFFGSFPFLFWNEGRAVRRQRDLDEGVSKVLDIALSIQATTKS